MLKSFASTIIAVAIVLAASACDKSTGDSTAAQAKVEIQGELNEASYKQAVSKVLAEARQAMSDSATTEDRVDAGAAKIEGLLVLADKVDVDKATLGEAELMSTLGALYTRKAAFHTDSAQQAGIYSGKGFRYMDRAVTKYPDNITARLNRGMTSAKVPEFMNKSSVARDDLRYVLGRPEFAKLPSGLQASVRAALVEVEQRLAKKEAGQS
jgi:hypothetical protein